MRRFLILYLFLINTCQLFGQKKLPAFGEIDVADLQMKSCSFEPDATAMKLFDVSESQFTQSLSGETKLVIEQRTRIKIFSEKGYPYATIRVPYLDKKGMAKIKEIRGIVYNLDATGKVVTQKLEKADFFKQKVVGNWSLVNFTFPGLKVGSVIEFSYTRIEKNIYEFDPWRIQDDIPTAYSSYTIIAPETSNIVPKVFGQVKVDSTTSVKKFFQSRTTVLYTQNIPSFVPETMMTSKTDNQTKIIFFHERGYSFYTSMNPSRAWADMGERLLRHEGFGGQLKKMIPGAKTIIDSAVKVQSERERIKYLFAAVKNRFPGKKQQSLYVEDLSEAWDQQIANSSEVNLILLNLLGHSKIISYPLLVSTRENGRIDKSFPSFSQLNGVDVVAMIDSSNYFLLDASSENQSYDIPPVNVLNREALLLRPSNIGWFLINDDRPLFKQSINIVGEINEDGIIDGQATVQHYDYAKSYALDTTEAKKDEEKFTDKKKEGLKIVSSEMVLSDNDGDPLFEVINFNYELPRTNEFLFITPHFLNQQSRNPFISEKRYTDIDFGSNQEVITSIQLTFPASFTIDQLPENKTIRATDSSFFYRRTISKDGSQLHITSIFRITKPLFPKEQYEGVKDFFKQMFALHNEEILLIKKK